MIVGGRDMSKKVHGFLQSLDGVGFGVKGRQSSQLQQIIVECMP